MKLVKILLIASVLSLSACNEPKLPDPTIAYPKPPEALMVPTKNMEPIPNGNNL